MKGEVLGDGDALLMHAGDNVATALEDLEPGDTIGDELTVTSEVPFGHKLALEAIDEGGDVVKYGEVIGAASEAIAAGEWVHTHNCESKRGRGDLAAKEVSNA